MMARHGHHTEGEREQPVSQSQPACEPNILRIYIENAAKKAKKTHTDICYAYCE